MSLALAAGATAQTAEAALNPSSAPPPQAAAPYAGVAGPGSLTGLWYRTGYLGTANHTPRERIARDINGRIPGMLPWARDLLEKRVTDAEKGNIFANNAALCLPQGIPYMLFGAVEGPQQIFEQPDQVTLITEEGNEIWRIFLNAKHAPIDDIEPSYHGESVGHWEGDTLVVDTLGLNTRTTLDQVGMPHSDALHVMFRIRRASQTTLEFLVTIDDPKTFTAPWTQRLIYRLAKPGERQRDFVCENNRNAPDANGFQSFQVK